MSAKVLFALATLVVVISAAPSSLHRNPVSYRGHFLQYVMPIVPPDEILFGAKKVPKLVGAGKCIKPTLDFCQKQFADALGQSPDIFNDPYKFAEVIAGYYKLQINKGLLKMCSAQSQFRNCLNFFYESCTDPLTIFTFLKDIDKAFVLGGVYDDIEFDCGGGLVQALTNWQCIVKVNNNPNYDTKIQSCFDAYNNATTSDPNTYCAAGQNFSTCLTQAYTSLDSCAASNKPVQWWVCERSNRRTKLDGYCDANTCDFIFAPTSGATIRENVNEEFIKFIQSGGLISKTRQRYFKLAGMTREQRKQFLANERQ